MDASAVPPVYTGEIGVAPISPDLSALKASGRTPLSKLEPIGVLIVANPAGLLRAAIRAGWDFVHGFAAHGTRCMEAAEQQLSGHPTAHLHEFADFSEIRRFEKEVLKIR